MSPHPRLARTLRLIPKIFGYLLLGLVALAATVLLLINLPPVSNWVAGRVNAALEPTFKGRLVLHRLGHLDFGGITGADVEVFDPAGASVVAAHDIDVRLFWPGVAWQAVVQRPDTLRVPIDRVGLDSVDIVLIDDGQGSPTLAQAFEPREPKPEEPESGATAIEVDALEIETTRVRGNLSALGPIDTDLGQLRAELRNDPAGTHVVLKNLAIDARQLPQVGTVSGRLTADVTLPTTPDGRESEPGAPASKPAAPTSSAPVANRSGPSTQVYALSPEPVRRIVAAFDGSIAGSQADADVTLEGEKLDATFQAGALQPSTLKQLVPALSPKSPLSLSAKVSGMLDDLAFEARLLQQRAEIAARGSLARAQEGSKVKATLTASKVDLSRLMEDAAETALNLNAEAALDMSDTGGRGSYELVSDGSRYAGQTLPKATLAGQLRLPGAAPIHTQGQLKIAEPGAPATLDYDVTLADAGPIADVTFSTQLKKPPRLRELSGGANLMGEIASKAHYDAAHDAVDAELRANLVDVRRPGLRLARLDVAAMARGSASTPQLELLANVTGLSAGDRTWSRVRVHARGTSETLNVDAHATGNKPDDIRLTAVVAPGSKEPLRSPVLRVKDDAGTVVVRAGKVTQNGERLRVERLTIEGPGRAEASLTLGRELERLTLDADQLDASRLLRIAGVKSPVRSAKLDIDADYRGGARPSGKLALNVSDITLGKLRGGSASADFVIDKGKLSGEADIELARGAKTHVAIERLDAFGGRPPSLETLDGDVELAGDIDLSRLQPFLPFAGVERATGQLAFDVKMKRKPGSTEPPEFRAKLRSKQLVLVSERPDAEQMPSADQARVTAPWTLRGVDVAVDATLEQGGARLEAHVFDRAGDVFAANATFERLGDLADPAGAFQRAPFTASLSVPRRAFEHWPAPIRPAEIQGALTLQVDADGTLTDPRVHARGRVDGFRAASESRRARKVDVELGAQYQATGGHLLLKAHDKDDVVLGLDSRWTGDVARAGTALEAPPDAPSPLLADVKVDLHEFPVDVIPQLSNRHIRGNLSGKAVLSGLGKDATFDLDLGAKRIMIDRLLLDDIQAKVKTGNGQLEAQARMRGGDGGLEVRAKTGLDWGKRLVPVSDQQLEGSFHAEKFPLATLQPVVEGNVSELDGKLDADIQAALEAGQPRLSGRAQLSEGVVHLPSIGQRFSDIGAKVEITPGRLRVQELKGRGVNGAFEAEAEAQLKGLEPVSATAKLGIEEDHKLPLTVEGEAIGDAWGSIVTQYRVDEANKTRNIQVDLKKFHIELPAAPPQGIQDLAQAEHVRVGYFRRDGEFVTVPLQPMEEPSEPSEYQTIVNVDLGELWVEKGDQVEVGIAGKIQAKLDPELDVTGKIETKRGELFVQGKSFAIERGTVTFTGGPPDSPIISAVARYDAPAGYTVYAEYTGTATAGKLDLRSEPPLSQDEILTLLMFGTPDGSFGAGTEGGNDLSTAVSVVGSTAAQGINRALSKITDLDVSARVDTSTGAPRPELVLQISPRVTARVTQALGEPSPGQSPDRTFVTIELRVASAWALSTMVGDRGASAFDVIWRKRY